MIQALSDKTRFELFARTVPPDTFQVRYLGRGSKIKKNKSREFSLSPRPPPPPLESREFIYDFFQHPRFKFALVFDAIQDIWNQGKRGTRKFKLNIFQRIVGYLRVIWTSESTQKSRIRKHPFMHSFTK